MKRTIRTNKWHAVAVHTCRDDDGVMEIRVNSDPLSDVASSYVSPESARNLIRALFEALRVKQVDDTKRTKRRSRR